MSKQSITIEVDLLGKATSLSETIGKLQSDLSKLDLGKGLQESFKTNFAVINSEIEKIQNIAAKKKINVIDDKQIQKSLSAIETAYASVLHKLESEGVNTSFLKQDKKAIDALTTANKNYTNSVKETRGEYNKLAKELEKTQNSQKDSRGKIESKRVLSDSDYKKLEDEIQRLEAEKKAATSARGTAAGQLTRKYGKGWQQDTSKIPTEELEKYNEKAEKAEALTEQLKAKQDQLNNSISNSAKTKAIGDLDSALQKIKDSMAKVDDAASFEKIKQELLAIKDVDWGSLGIDINSINNVEQLNTALTKLGTDAGERAKQVIANIGGNSQVASGQLNNARTAVDGYTKSLQEMTDRERDIQGIKSRITHFFGLANAINLARRAMRQAFNAVKELDAAMTETAVVTDFSVGDMWDQLPRYTEAANRLGATTLGAYQTMTLFYQQGLDTNEAFALGTETMKMARIAGLDYADATDKMTAALRGFNMELNEASAQRVNDVYSELAAITAADTEEIANAMTKTASIAHNANMEFETTAAFLSQIIETTRESAETAGTAMKTVIARFQELKKDPSEIGEVDGEIVDANKIETALRSVGVALRDSTGQFRDLDDVFLELASKWDGLDTNTQRYIATIAAGSRQQSRFIAMMSNYERTIELVNAANNSAGASQNQFNKTLESLEAKLNNLKNAWNEFTMGITNNQAIKFGVDALTWLLNIINKVTGVAGNEGIGGLITAISKLALAWTGLRAGKAVLAGLSTSLSKAGVEAGISMSRGIRDGFAAEFGKGSIIKRIISQSKIAPEIPGLNAYKTQLIGIAETEQYYSRILATTTANTVEAREARAMMAALTEMEKESELELCGALKLTESQQEQANAMKAIGIPYDQAAVLAKNDLTKAQLREMAIARLGNEEDEREIKITMKKIALEKLDGKTIQLSTGARIKNYAALLFSSKAKRAETAVTLGLAVADEGATVATNSLTAALLACPIGWIIAALAALGVAIALVIKNSPEQKLKRANAAAEEAGEAVEKLTDEFNNLKSSVESLEDKYDSLEELTRGTEEWRKAVSEVNQEVLQLLDTYPELARFISWQQGVLTLDSGSKEYQQYMEEQQQQIYKATAAKVGFDLEANKIQYEVDRSALESEEGFKEVKLTLFESTADGEVYDTSTTTQIAKALAEGEVNPQNQEELEQFFTNLGYTGDKLKYYIAQVNALTEEEINTLETYGHRLLNLDQEYEFQTQAEYASAISATTLQSGLEGEDADKAAAYLSGVFEGFVEDAKEEIGTLTREEKERYAELMGYNFVRNMRFEDEEGNKIEDITADGVRAALAMADASERGAEAQKEIIKNFENIIKAAGELSGTFERLLTGVSGEGLTLEDFSEEITYQDGINTDEEEILRKDAAATYEGLVNLYGAEKTEELFGTQQEFQDRWVADFTHAAEVLENATKMLPKEITIEQLGFSNVSDVRNFSNQVREMSVEETQAYIDEWNKLMSDSSLTDTERNQLATYLSSVDWSDIEDATAAMEYMQNLRLNPDNIQSFWNVATQAAGAYVSTVDQALSMADSLIKSIQADKEMAERLKSGEGTAEDIQALIAEGVELEGNVELTDTGWKWVGIESRLDDIISIMLGRKGQSSKGIWQSTLNRRKEFDNKKDSMVQQGFLNYNEETGTYEGIQIGKNFPETLKIAEIIGAQAYDPEQWNNDRNAWRDYVQEEYDEFIRIGNLTPEEIGQIDFVVEQEAQYAGVEYLTSLGPNLWDASGYTEEEKNQAADVLLEREGATYNAINFANQIEEDTDAVVDAEKAGKKLALNYAEINKKLEKVNKVVEENAEVLTKANRGTQEYSKAMGEVKTALEDAFEMEIDDETLLQHQDIVERIAQGETEAIFDLGKVLILESEEITKGFGDIIDSGNDMFNVVSNIAKTIPPIGVATSYDGSGFADAMGGLDLLDGRLVMSRAQIEAFRRAYSMIGGSVEFETEYVWVNKKTGLMTTPTKLSNNILRGNTTLGEWDKMEVIKSVSVTGTGAGGGVSSGGGGGGGKEEKWENPYDEFYNITEQINEELRTREQIEHDYNKLLKDRRTSIDEIRQSQLDQIASLRRELDLQQQLLEGRKRQYSKIGQETYADEEGNYKSFSEWGVTKYASYDDKTGLITIDWEGIDQITDTEFGGAVEAYISQIEEWSGSIEDIEDEIRDIEDQIEDIKNAEKDAYLEFEERIYEALLEADQKVIDTYQELFDTISDSNEKILNSLSESIELERQIRDNTKTEEEIADKEARLAYLRRDTSGANDLEIKQLEEELADARESYGDTLIDQELDRLNKVNEEAVEQREKQIELMQAQLDWNEQNGIYWARVDNLLANAINSGGTFNYNSELAKILEESEAFKGMSAFGQMNWINELVEEFLTANRGFENWMVDKAEEEGMVTLADGTSLTYDDTNKVWYDKKGNTYEDIAYNSQTQSYEPGSIIKTPESDDSGSQDDTTTPEEPEFQKPELTDGIKRGVSAAIHRGGLGWGNDPGRAEKLKEVFGADNNIQRGYVDLYKTSGFEGSVFDYSYDNMRKKFLGFKTGGLADFTGPAWLDGTKTRPEMVLNQTDTQNFIQLKDILSSLLNRGTSNTQTSGDNYYNFDITVEEIGSDYDVDQMIDRVRERIYDDASYRNVNAINFLR